jgi:2-C-methyl-D-erythritol 4-phosphate cytidylyltransferase
MAGRDSPGGARGYNEVIAKTEIIDEMRFPSFVALIPAAGVGARMGGKIPKQYAPLAGKPMLQHVIDVFCSAPQIDHVYVVVSAGDEFIDALSLPERCTVLRCGGDTRQASVTNGLQAMADAIDPDDWVLVHDAARPGLTVALIDKLIAFVREDEVGGLLALPVVDTVKHSDGHGRAERTVSRELLWAAQTPQMFRHRLLLDAMQRVSDITDEASAIEALGLHPKLVEGSPRNFKVTLPEDVSIAELHLRGHA